jgi:hypothetical protein
MMDVELPGDFREFLKLLIFTQYPVIDASYFLWYYPVTIK